MFIGHLQGAVKIGRPGHGSLWQRPLAACSTSISLFFKVYLFLRQREREIQVQAGEGQRGKETQNPKQAPGSELSAESLMRGSNSQAVRS